MKLVSEDILTESNIQTPAHEAVYPMLEDFELWNPTAWTKGHPFDFYRRMRETAPVMWSRMGRGGNGFWSLSRYEDIKHVELAPQTFSSQRGSMGIFVPPRKLWRPKRGMQAGFNSLINLDAPRHLEMRIQQKDFFIPNFVSSLRERVGRKIDALLDDMERKGPVVDFVKVFSTELPLFTLCEMLGVDEADRPRMIHWMHYLELGPLFLASPLKMLFKEPSFLFRFDRVLNEMFEYGERVMLDRRANPRQDLLTAIAQTRIDDEHLPQEYLDGSWLLIVFAGNDTSRNSLSGTIKLMTEFPDQRAMVLDDPSLISRMSQEALRMVTPVKYMRRTATQETEINGQRIGEDEKVVMWYGAANRDPAVFPDPDRFDLTRDNVDRHLAFGHGVHKCLGSRIAEMQLTMAYERIFERFPNITWTGHEKIAPITLVHAISSMKVNLYGPDGKRPVRVPGHKT